MLTISDNTIGTNKCRHSFEFVIKIAGMNKNFFTIYSEDDFSELAIIFIASRGDDGFIEPPEEWESLACFEIEAEEYEIFDTGVRFPRANIYCSST